MLLLIRAAELAAFFYVLPLLRSTAFSNSAIFRTFLIHTMGFNPSWAWNITYYPWLNVQCQCSECNGKNISSTSATVTRMLQWRWPFSLEDGVEPVKTTHFEKWGIKFVKATHCLPYWAGMASVMNPALCNRIYYWWPQQHSQPALHAVQYLYALKKKLNIIILNCHTKPQAVHKK